MDKYSKLGSDIVNLYKTASDIPVTIISIQSHSRTVTLHPILTSEEFICINQRNVFKTMLSTIQNFMQHIKILVQPFYVNKKGTLIAVRICFDPWRCSMCLGSFAYIWLQYTQKFVFVPNTFPCLIGRQRTSTAAGPSGGCFNGCLLLHSLNRRGSVVHGILRVFGNHIFGRATQSFADLFLSNYFIRLPVFSRP